MAPLAQLSQVKIDAPRSLYLCTFAFGSGWNSVGLVQGPRWSSSFGKTGVQESSSSLGTPATLCMAGVFEQTGKCEGIEIK